MSKDWRDERIAELEDYILRLEEDNDRLNREIFWSTKD